MDITVQELKQKLDNKEEFVFIDVREPYEYEEFNLGAQLIPLATVPSEMANLEQYKDSEIVVHCRSGARSANAQQFLRANGFNNVRNLLGGVVAWQKEFV
ncbi:MAG: rhodanese-like domain-containing protein [Saprospiraceae bacterium]|jgi:rhodanese-related sulfurtransferase|nr:rhodanese-like domain-containing protein [Saprospiraceae bacterium]